MVDITTVRAFAARHRRSTVMPSILPNAKRGRTGGAWTHYVDWWSAWIAVWWMRMNEPIQFRRAYRRRTHIIPFGAVSHAFAAMEFQVACPAQPALLDMHRTSASFGDALDFRGWSPMARHDSFPMGRPRRRRRMSRQPRCPRFDGDQHLHRILNHIIRNTFCEGHPRQPQFQILGA